MSEYQKLINTNIKKLRLKSNLTREKFSELIGISPDTIANIENNRYVPRPDTIDKICSALNIEYFELLTPEVFNNKKEIILFINSKLESLKTIELNRLIAIIDALKLKE